MPTSTSARVHRWPTATLLICDGMIGWSSVPVGHIASAFRHIASAFRPIRFACLECADAVLVR